MEGMRAAVLIAAARPGGASGQALPEAVLGCGGGPGGLARAPRALASARVQEQAALS